MSAVITIRMTIVLTLVTPLPRKWLGRYSQRMRREGKKRREKEERGVEGEEKKGRKRSGIWMEHLTQASLYSATLTQPT